MSGRNSFWATLTVWYVATSFTVVAQTSPLPWFAAIGVGQQQLEQTHSVYAEATVTPSSGQGYVTVTLFHDQQRAIFHREYSDRSVTSAVDGRYVWEFDGQTEKEAQPWVEGFVLGHQFHARLLFFDRFGSGELKVSDAIFAEQSCRAISSSDRTGSWTVFYLDDSLPLGMKHSMESMEITFAFADWRDVDGIKMPFVIDIDDGSRQFHYQFTNISWNRGAFAEMRAPMDVLTAEQQLLRLHRLSMDAHRFGTFDSITAYRGDRMLMVSDGEVHTMSADQSTEMMQRIMSSRIYDVYDDLIRPEVEVSADGTLGWVIAQISAQGRRLDSDGNVVAPLQFVCAWVALYEKVDGQWQLVGNVSNFQPGRQ